MTARQLHALQELREWAKAKEAAQINAWSPCDRSVLEAEAAAYRHAGEIVEAIAVKFEELAAEPVPYEGDSFRYRAQAFRDAARLVRGDET